MGIYIKQTMKATEFIANLQKVKNTDLQDALNWSVGRVHPLDEPDKFVKMHKKDLNMKKILSEAIYNFFMKCTQKSVRLYPRSVVKQVTHEMELKKKALPTLIKDLESFYPKIFTLVPKATICRIGCSTFGCHYDNPNNPICDMNYCDDCEKQR
jgi:hypothetical protein